MVVMVYLVLVMCWLGFNDVVVQLYCDFFDVLQVQGKLQLIGGFVDGSGGVYVLCNVDSLVQVQVIVVIDLLVMMQVFDLIVYEWNIC